MGLEKWGLRNSVFHSFFLFYKRSRTKIAFGVTHEACYANCFMLAATGLVILYKKKNMIEIIK